MPKTPSALPYRGWLVVASLFVVVAWTAVLLYTWPDNGTVSFGDGFESLSALFSGLAFVGLVYAIFLQQSELSLQRAELKATREELAGQKEQLQIQNKTLKVQAFENTFFQVLRLQSDIVASISTMTNGQPNNGRINFEFFYGELRHHFNNNTEINASHPNRLQAAYSMLYKNHEADLGHYFRSLYNIIKLVDRSEVENKRLYTNIVRAQLSKFELLILFYNCLTAVGIEKFKPLVEKYSLLKTISREDLLNDVADIALYEKTAFNSTGA